MGVIKRYDASLAHFCYTSSMDNKTEGTISVLAAIVVLFSAMFSAETSMILAVAALMGLGIYHFTAKH